MSLRLRLVLIILAPLLMIAGAVGIWAVRDAQDRAAERFDLSLLSATLAISGDVAASGGDALSAKTTALIRDTSGGQVFYHVHAPDGVFVTGYATPPVPPSLETARDQQQLYFDGTHLGAPVRGLRFVDTMQIDGLSGKFTFTVWQDQALRRALVQDLSWRTFRVMASLVVTVALVVWFGVRTGLAPLLDLESAIAKRSPDDLTPIRRKVPAEAQGIAERLNQLFVQVTGTLQAKDSFVSNAAHQLRNPIAGVVAMSEAVESAPSYDTMKARSADLVQAARRAGDLAEKLLTLDRASSGPRPETLVRADLTGLLAQVAEGFAGRAAGLGVDLVLDLPPRPVPLRCDPTLLSEAVVNLIDNALTHAKPSRIDLSLRLQGGDGLITVADDGAGIPPQDLDRVKERFAQARDSKGSGLGLAIADAIVGQLGGALAILAPKSGGTRIVISLPIGARAQPRRSYPPGSPDAA